MGVEIVGEIINFIFILYLFVLIVLVLVLNIFGFEDKLIFVVFFDSGYEIILILVVVLEFFVGVIGIEFWGVDSDFEFRSVVGN